MRSSIADMMTPTPVGIPLSDAVTLYAIQTDRFKTARLSIYTVTPADEVQSPLGTLLFGILRRGSQKYPRLSLLNRRLDELYGTTLTLRNFLRGDNHVLSFTAEMLSDAYTFSGDDGNILEGTMEVMAEMLLHPLRDEQGFLRRDTVEAEVISMIDSIRAEVNDPRTYAATKLRQTMCEGEPFGLSLSGSIPLLETVTPEVVSALLHDRLQRAHWEVYYVGSESPDTVADTFRRCFAGFMPQVLPLSTTHPHLPPASVRRVEEELPVEQGKLCIAWSSGITDQTPAEDRRDDYAAAVVLCELLGIMQSSLLFRRVREELGLCYDCDAAWEGKKGILSVTSGIHPKNRAVAEQAILAVFADIQAGVLADADVALAKISLENSYRQLPDSPAAMESYWFWQTPEHSVLPESHLQRFLSVTREDIIRVAQMFSLDTVYFLNATCAGEEDEDE